MKIGIFETDHFEGAYPIIKLFDNGENEIFIYTYAPSFRQFQYLLGDEVNRYTWIIKEPELGKIRFIMKMSIHAKKNQIQLMFFNTISNNFIFYALSIAFLKKVRVIITLHDINGYFQFKPIFSIRRWVRFLGKKILIKTVKEFNVVSSTMIDYLKNKLSSTKIVHCIPGAIFENFLPNNISLQITNPLKIVIPGSIDERRRDYRYAFDLLKLMNEKGLPVLVIFLGGFNTQFGKSILNKCQLYRSKNHNLQFYDEHVIDQPEFDRVMNEAHFVFMPSVIHTVLADDVLEIYGKSISSGNIFDVIKHAKPFISPVGLVIPENIESSCFRYSQVYEIVCFLEELLTYPDRYKKWSESAFRNSLEYTPRKIIERNRSLFYPKNVTG